MYITRRTTHKRTMYATSLMLLHSATEPLMLIHESLLHCTMIHIQTLPAIFYLKTGVLAAAWSPHVHQVISRAISHRSLHSSVPKCRAVSEAIEIRAWGVCTTYPLRSIPPRRHGTPESYDECSAAQSECVAVAEVVISKKWRSRRRIQHR